MIRRLVGLVVLAAALAGCAPTAPTAPAASVPAPAPVPSNGQVHLLRIRLAGGQVSGDTGTVPVALGEQVRLEVTSDTAEEAHLHGYDLAAQVPAGGAATIDFSADLPGEFEFELHHSGAPMATLRVS